MKLKQRNIFLLTALIPLIFLFSCNLARKLADGEYLLKKNILKVDNKEVQTDDLEGLIKQKPNKKVIRLFRFNLRIYNFASNRGKETKVNIWIKKTMGEPPVIVDTTLTNYSMKNMQRSLFNKGYFDAKVTKEIRFLKKKKQAVITYIAKTGTVYKINEVNFVISDPLISTFILSQKSASLIKEGINYDIDVLEAERERITKILKNRGYYNFSKEYIIYNVDSSLNDHKVNLSVVLKNMIARDPDKPDSVIRVPHKRYYINKVFIYPEFDVKSSDSVKYDTTIFYVQNINPKADPLSYYFLKKGRFHISPKTISRSVYIQPGEHFILDDIDKTYNSLNELKNFKYINIQFNKAQDDSSRHDNLLDCYIYLSRMPLHSIAVEGEGTNSSGDLGVAGNLVYQNKNIFRGAEILRLKVKGALEVQRIFSENSSLNTEKKFLLFNTFEAGFEASIDFPKFLFPFVKEKTQKTFKPKTRLSSGYNFQQRPDYRRHILNLTYSYYLKQSENLYHTLTLADINSVKIYPETSFIEYIGNIRDPYLKSQYTDHLVTSIRYGLFYSNQQINKIKNFIFLKSSIETAGNLPYLVNTIAGSQKNNSNNYQIIGIQYAQYVLADIDFRYYNIISQKSSIVYRVALGGGFSYGNLKVLPFEKGFFAGGANSIRAWKLKSLGPGSYLDTNNFFDKIGDIKLEMNAEVRFPIYSFIRGALFIDAGNIWFSKARENFPGGEFKFDRFLREIAIGGGVGLRFDFSFFVIRIDAAVPFKNPALPENQRWVFDKAKFSNIVWNFGIGYPF